MKTTDNTAIGYVYCAHELCFAEIIGIPGDLCPDCLAAEPEADAKDCDGCDNDLVQDHED